MEEATNTGSTDLRPLTDLSDTEIWAVVDASPDGMLLTDELGVILFVNSQVECLFHYDRADLLGQTIELLLPEHHRQRHAAHRTRYRAEPTTRVMGGDLDLVGRRKDGVEFPVEVSLSPVTTPDGLRVVATVRDITERRQAEAHTHAVLHTLDAAHDGVFMFEPDSLRFSYVNQGAARQLGYPADELLTMTPLHIKPEFTEQSFRAMLGPLLDGTVDSHTFTTTHRRRDGVDLPVEIVLEYPPPAKSGEARVLIALVRNISERLRRERVARAQQARLQILEDRERVARDLHDVVIQRLFATGMALQAIQPLAMEPRLRERLATTVEQLDLSIAELRTAIFHLTTRDVAAADEIEKRLTEAAVGLGHQPGLTISGDLETIEPVVLEQLLATLNEALSNIARHAEATVTEVSIDLSDDSVVLSVSDNGKGIDPTAPRGNGLTNVEHRAKRLGGAASITSSPDSGTTVTWSARRVDPSA